MFGVALLHVALLSGPALAQDAPPPPPPAAPVDPAASKRFKLRAKPNRKQRGLSLTLSGGLVADLVVEGTGEINLPDRHAAAIILGAGSFQQQGSGLIDQLYVHAGLQYRYTVLGDFDMGLYVGLEGLAKIQPLAQGLPWELPLSPMLGFKYTAPFGLVADVNAGPSVVVTNFGPVRAGAMLNVQLGWAFGKKLKL